MIFFVFIVGASPALISAVLHPGSNEQVLVPSFVTLQVSLTQYSGIVVFIVMAFLLVLDIQFSGFRVNILAFTFFPFLLILIVSSFRRDSYVLQTSFQVLFYFLVINSRDISEWDFSRNIKNVARIVLIFELYFILLGGSEYWQDCRLDKCLYSGQRIFVGQFASGNGASVFFAVLVVVVVSLTRGKSQLFFGSIFTILCFLGGGRNAMLGLLIFFLAYLIKSHAVNSMLLTTAAVVGALPLFVTFPDEFATYRGYLWSQTRKAILDSGGYAPTITFREFVSDYLSVVPQGTEAPHNLWLGVWWDGGILGLLTFVPIFMLILVKSQKISFFSLQPLLVFYFVVNATDPISSFTHFDSFSWLLFIILISLFDRNKATNGVTLGANST